MKKQNGFLLTQIVSNDGVYRYVLDCTWDKNKPKIMFIGVSPRAEQLDNDDRTVQYLCSVTKSLRKNFGGFYLLSPIAYIKKQFEKLSEVPFPVGRENLMYLDEYMDKADLIIPCWGDTGLLWEMGGVVFSLIERDIKRVNKTFCLGLTKQGQPTQRSISLDYLVGNNKLIKYKNIDRVGI